MAGQKARLPHEARRGVPSQAAPPAPRPAPQRQRPRTFGALDLGTNNCRLLIARARADGELTIVDAFSRIVRLGEGLQASGKLSDAAIERAIEALRICADKLRRRGVHLSRSAAAMRCSRRAMARLWSSISAAARPNSRACSMATMGRTASATG